MVLDGEDNPSKILKGKSLKIKRGAWEPATSNMKQRIVNDITIHLQGRRQKKIPEGEQREKDRKIAKKDRKIALVNLYLLYLYHV